MPLGIFFLIYALSLFLKNKNKKKATLWLAFIWLYLISNLYVVTKAFQWWEWPYQNIGEVQKTYDVGIVLSGGMIGTLPINADHASMGPSADRFTQAFLLYKAGKIKKIFITGFDNPTKLHYKMGETRQAALFLTKWGVKAEDILFEEGARNTRENAVNSQKVLTSRYPKGEFLLITSASHMRRAKGCFDKVGMVTDAYATTYKGEMGDQFAMFYLIPNPTSMANFDEIWHEWVGYITYKIMGYC